VLTKPTEKEKKEMTAAGTIKSHLRFQQMMQGLYADSGAKDAYDERASYRFTADKAMKLGWDYAGKYDVELREFVTKSSRKRSTDAAMLDPDSAAAEGDAPAEVPGDVAAAENDPEVRKLGVPNPKRGRKAGTDTSTSTASTGTAAGSSSSAAIAGSAIQIDLRNGGIIEVLLPGKLMSFSALSSGDYTWAVKDAPVASGR
jgi:hypothetical protein